MIGGEVPLFPILLLGAAALVVIVGITWSERASSFTAPGVTKLDSGSRKREHRCRLPWWRPFRALGERVQCDTCKTTWRWDRYDWAPGDSCRMWINEQAEAEQAEVADRARRNAH